MSKHTPGPWSHRTLYATNNTRSAVFRECMPGYVQRLDDRGAFEHSDAALIAAAPELYEALKAAGQSAGFQYMTHETRDLIDNAISKAEGQS